MNTIIKTKKINNNSINVKKNIDTIKNIENKNDINIYLDEKNTNISKIKNISSEVLGNIKKEKENIKKEIKNKKFSIVDANPTFKDKFISNFKGVIDFSKNTGNIIASSGLGKITQKTLSITGKGIKMYGELFKKNKIAVSIGTLLLFNMIGDLTLGGINTSKINLNNNLSSINNTKIAQDLKQNDIQNSLSVNENIFGISNVKEKKNTNFFIEKNNGKIIIKTHKIINDDKLDELAKKFGIEKENIKVEFLSAEKVFELIVLSDYKKDENVKNFLKKYEGKWEYDDNGNRKIKYELNSNEAIKYNDVIKKLNGYDTFAVEIKN